MKLPVALASFGLALNVMLWSVPAMVGASALPHALLPDNVPGLADVLASAERRPSGGAPNLLDALVQLVGAEAEAMQVAGAGLKQSPPADLASQADHAGNRVLAAVTAYVGAAKAALH
jgi:hypothetical protein